MSCPCYWNVAELRPFWEHWKTLCLVHFLAGLGWLGHVHGSRVALQELQQMEWAHVLSGYRLSPQPGAVLGRWMFTRQIWPLWFSPWFCKDAGFGFMDGSHHLPAAWSCSSSPGGASPPAWTSPCPRLAPLSCSQGWQQAGCWQPS